jgi:hypothetical protein
VTLADICLVPQVFNARRFKVDMAKYPKHRRVGGGLPESFPPSTRRGRRNQPDAE